MINQLDGVILLGITIGSFLWVFKLKDKVFKIFIFLLISMLYIYCGIGVVYQQNVDINYELTYCLYIITLSFSSRYFYKKNIGFKNVDIVADFSTKWSTSIIILYLFLCFIPLITQGKLGNLISPPPPMIGDVIMDTDFTKNQISNIAHSFENFIFLFYYIALFKFIKKPWFLVFLLLLPTYIGYCSYGYAARSGTLYKIAIVYSVLYYYYPKIRKLLIVITILIIPTILIFLVNFEGLRQGVYTINMTAGDAIEHLLRSETSYVNWYKDIESVGGEYVFNYVYWVSTLPLPGFLKPFAINTNFTALFTSDVLGVDITSVTSIMLPGLVNEGVYVFGKYFFFIHAIIFAAIFIFCYNTLRKDPRLFISLLAIMLEFSLISGRTGTNTYPIAIKMMFMIWIFKILTNKKNHLNKSYVSPYSNK